MRIEKFLISLTLFSAFGASALSQELLAPEPQPAHIAGTVTDTNDDMIPGATITLNGPQQNAHSVETNDRGFFQIDNIAPGTPIQVTVRAAGFTDWQSAEIVLSPSQFDILDDIKLKIESDAVSVVVTASREEIAVEQVKMEEQQRMLGFIPNFYVSYSRNVAPLTFKLKFEMAAKVSIDPVTFVGASVVAASGQAGHYPNYPEGISGYGQRFGSIYANGLTDIMVGGAILPAVLHQDPRYFYQGTGTTKSRLLHALSSPMICRGDNGRSQPNYSSLGGYLASGAISNVYYPESNRGAGLLFRTFGIDFSADIANGVLQEFVLRRLTSTARNRN